MKSSEYTQSYKRIVRIHSSHRGMEDAPSRVGLPHTMHSPGCVCVSLCLSVHSNVLFWHASQQRVWVHCTEEPQLGRNSHMHCAVCSSQRVSENWTNFFQNLCHWSQVLCIDLFNTSMTLCSLCLLRNVPCLLANTIAIQKETDLPNGHAKFTIAVCTKLVQWSH